MPRISAVWSRPPVTAYVALLRAVNVGGTGMLAMADLKRLCEAAGFRAVRTYIASGNVVFQSEDSEEVVKSAMEQALERHVGEPVGVHIRTSTEVASVLACNPFAGADPKSTVAVFLDAAPPMNLADTIKGQAGERIALGAREIYVDYGTGIGRSKLKIPAAATGTARNMNTVAKLSAMAAEKSETM